MTNLIPEQVSFLRRRQREIVENLKKEGYEVRNGDIYRDGEAISLLDEAFEANIHNISEYKSLRDTLTSSCLYKPIRNSNINLGSKVHIKFSGEEETEELTLVENTLGFSASNLFVSINSPLGLELVNKKEKDAFSYIVGNRNISGTVEKVFEEKTSYVNYLREEDVIEKKITPSQRDLLVEEKERISSKFDSKDRVKIIDKMLNSSKVVESDKIGLGSHVKFFSFDNEYELINKAVSDELDDSYIELTSELGKNIIDKNKNGEFSFETKDGKVEGKVYSLKKGKDK